MFAKISLHIQIEIKAQNLKKSQQGAYVIHRVTEPLRLHSRGFNSYYQGYKQVLVNEVM